MLTFRILYNKKKAKITKKKSPNGLLSFEIIDKPNMAEANRYAVDTYKSQLVGITDITEIKHLYLKNESKIVADIEQTNKNIEQLIKRSRTNQMKSKNKWL